jgi:HEPN domain-containing protein
MKPPEEVKGEFVRQWLGKADDDLRACRQLVEESDLLAIAGFHAQQAAEKALKAILVWHQIEFSKSHDMGRILELLAVADRELAAKVSGASVLTPFAVQYRYPGDLPEPTVTEIKEALRIAELVLAETLNRLPQGFREAREKE